MRLQAALGQILSVFVLPTFMSGNDPSFPILEQNQVYKRYISVWDRNVRFPDGRTIRWDVAGHNVPAQPTYSVVFPYFTADNSTTLVREYAQGPNELVYTLPAGIYERNKSATIQESAASELSEEARLRGGEWIRLLPDEHDGISELKWCTNRFIPFLVINPVRDLQPGKRDDEEFIRIHDHVPLTRLKQLILDGSLMLPSVQTSFMAVAELEKRGHKAW